MEEQERIDEGYYKKNPDIEPGLAPESPLNFVQYQGYDYDGVKELKKQEEADYEKYVKDREKEKTKKRDKKKESY